MFLNTRVAVARAAISVISKRTRIELVAAKIESRGRCFSSHVTHMLCCLGDLSPPVQKSTVKASLCLHYLSQRAASSLTPSPAGKQKKSRLMSDISHFWITSGNKAGPVATSSDWHHLRAVRGLDNYLISEKADRIMISG